jgi:predicted RNA-binding protein (virulence factor B family)
MMLDSSREYTMLKLNATAVLIFSALVGTSAVAAGQQDPASASVTREQVEAEVLAARAAGTLDLTEANYPHEFTAEKSTVTGAQVKAEVIRARAAGELDLPEGAFPVAHTPEKSQVTRAEVLAEVIRARNAGELETTEAM